MNKAFREAIQKAQDNPSLQAALDANAEKRITVRQNAMASLPDYPALRQRAHAIRADVIANLETYLDQFTQTAQSNGLIIHQAVDAAEAVQQVLEIARQHGASLVAKSKTMVSEEIELNHALEQAGLRVVETDLGEYIVQLRGERPAHIITPAVHLRRADVGQTFHEKLGMPLTDDIPLMTALARRVLRQVFLEAGIGLSGVNFGVAETGTLCLLTNEGNGRMVTTIPPVHIALMGIERLVPNLEDLAVMLALLPRSATGQKLTVYTSLIHKPRQPNDPDGPRERHVILVDNGRRRVAASPLAEILYCIRCGACLNACPVFREIGGHAYVGQSGAGTAYPGPIGSVVSPALLGGNEFSQLARASSLCGACREACPVDIDLPKLLLRVRAGKLPDPPGQKADSAPPAADQPQKVPWFLRVGLAVYSWAAVRPAWFHLAQKLVGAGSRLVSPRSTWLRLPAATGWGYSKDFPRPALRPFRDTYQANHSAYQSPNPGRLNAQEQQLPVDESISVPDWMPVLPGDASLVARFTEELIALGGVVIPCRPAELVEFVQVLLKEKGVERVTAWAAQELPPGLLEAVAAAGIQVGHQPDPTAKAGITGALAAIAETGTLAVTSGPGRPLSASLLPEIHIAVLQSDRVYATLSEVLSPTGPASSLHSLRTAASAALISGPSRTADIEMTLTIGVHGPGELYVFLVKA